MEEKKYLKLNDIEAYKKAFHLSNYVWDLVVNWKLMARNTVGEQFICAIDSVSANIAEGFGRYGKKDKIKFYRYGYGSVTECFDWNEKSKVRKLITNEEYNKIFNELKQLPKLIHQLINFTNEKLQE